MSDLDFSHGGNIYEAARKFGEGIIDFSANINPLGFPLNLEEILCENFDRILHYPDPKAEEITQGIAQYWGIKKENILVGNGSVELIYLITTAFKPSITMIPVPTFSEYERAARIIKSRIKFLRLKAKEDFKLNLSSIGNSDIFFFPNPNNPTGNLILDDYRMFAEIPSKLIVADEAFMDFLPDEKNHTLIWKASCCKKIVVLRTFTKFFALPGLRIGYIVAHKDIIQAIKQYQIPWSVNVLAQLAAERMLKNKTYRKDTRVFVNRERKFLFEEIAKIKGLIPYPSVANFLLVKIENENVTAAHLTNKLIQRGIFVRDCSNFRELSDKFIRVAIRSHKENLKFLDALKEEIV